MATATWGLVTSPSIYYASPVQVTINDATGASVVSGSVTVPDGTVITGGGYTLDVYQADGVTLAPSSSLGMFSVTKNGPLVNSNLVATKWEVEMFPQNSWLSPVAGLGYTAVLKVYACVGQTWSYGTR